MLHVYAINQSYELIPDTSAHRDDYIMEIRLQNTTFQMARGLFENTNNTNIVFAIDAIVGAV